MVSSSVRGLIFARRMGWWRVVGLGRIDGQLATTNNEQEVNKCTQWIHLFINQRKVKGL